jgi:oligopeptide transport system ATP-binding protein
LFTQVGIPDPESRLGSYPHQLSGGQRQRVMIAMALANEPDLFIADEPTTALDVTVQAQILELIREIRRDGNTAVILITHDLGVVAGLCDRVLVMYAGRVVEAGTVRDIFYRPQHPYTAGLLRSMPRLDERDHGRLQTIAGQPPNLQRLPPGCAFQERCERRFEPCLSDRPPLRPIGGDHAKACHLEQL